MNTTPTEHTARIEHACSVCAVPITPGTRYRRWRWFFENIAGTVKIHPDCEALLGDHFEAWDGDTLSEMLTGWMLSEQAEAAIARCSDRAVAAGWQALVEVAT